METTQLATDNNSSRYFTFFLKKYDDSVLYNFIVPPFQLRALDGLACG
jgi:hypothetical protein